MSYHEPIVLPVDHILFQGPDLYKGWLGYEYPCIISIIEMMLVCKDESIAEKINKIHCLLKTNRVQAPRVHEKLNEARDFFVDLIRMCKLIHSVTICSSWKNTQFIPAAIEDEKLYTSTQRDYANLLRDWINKVYAEFFR